MATTTYFLEMHSTSQLKPKPDNPGLVLMETEIKQFGFNRFLYQLVGEAWQWVDKQNWSDAQWRAWAESDDVRTWVAYHEGSPAGYFELHWQEPGDVEIAYFGLAPAFIGRGFGGYLLSQAVEQAWTFPGVKRVWVHTCDLDHPSALANYQARGFEIFKTETIAGE